jgi:hypothetical protein
MSFRVAMEGDVASFSNWEIKPLVRSARLANSSWVRELIILSRFSLSPIFKQNLRTPAEKKPRISRGV